MSDDAPKETGNGPDPVSGLGQNRGGRPRKDGSRADTRLTYQQAGISKRLAARMRDFGRRSDEEFEAALAQQRAEIERSGRVHALEYFLPDRRANSRLQRETRSNIARLASTLSRLERDYEGDGSETGEVIRWAIQLTRTLWGFDAK